MCDISKNNQLIMVTHSPQLVINCNAENIIYMQGDSFSSEEIVQSPLEGIVDINGDKELMIKHVADILDGGKEILSKRLNKFGTYK